MNRTVFIFGAGASVDAGLPSQDQLLKRYFQGKDENGFSQILELYFKDFFNVNFDNLDNAKIPIFEEALGIIELAIEREETFGPNYSIDKLKQIKQALILSMGIAIEKSNIPKHTGYDTLVNRLFHRGHFALNEYGFINFNYDILLDRALLNLLDNRIYIDYGIAFANEGADYGDFGTWRKPDKNRSVKYLKPHGSFNWMCCPTCNSIYIKGQGREKSRVFTTGYLHNIEHCPKDQTELYCPIEPPTFFKKYKNMYLQNIWHEIFNVLINAETVVFIGCSLQDSDIWIKYLIKKSCFGKTKKFVVINLAEEAQLKDKYERLLGKVDYYKLKFGDFAKNHKKYLPLLPKSNRISFNYNPKALGKHGWKIVSEEIGTLPSFTSVNDDTYSKILQIISTTRWYMDYNVRNPQNKLKRVEFIIDKNHVPPTSVLYVSVQVKKKSGQEEHEKWFNLYPPETQPENVSQDEKKVPAIYNTKNDNWIRIEANISELMERTYSKEGWVFDKILRIRIRGSVKIAAIEFK
ncbi:MAG: SIR2 family protein [Planctomycetota bacterium]